MKTIYVTDDGRQFNNKNDATRHEKTQEKFSEFLYDLLVSHETKQQIYKLLRDEGLNVPKEEDNTPKKKELELGINPKYYPGKEFTEEDTEHWIVIFHMELKSIWSHEDADSCAAQSYARACEVYDSNLCTWVYRGDYSQVVDFLDLIVEECHEIINRSVSQELIKKLNKEYYGC